MISKTSVLSPKYKHYGAHELRKDRYSNLPNQVFMWFKSLEDHQEVLYRVLLDPRSIQDSFKV